MCFEVYYSMQIEEIEWFSIRFRIFFFFNQNDIYGTHTEILEFPVLFQIQKTNSLGEKVILI